MAGNVKGVDDANGAPEKGAASAVPLREGERRTVTVLFSDMKGFTTLSERLDPEEMDALMNRVFARFEDCVRRRILEA